LQPSASPKGIDSWLIFGKGWSDDEGTHRWAETRNTKISIVNNDKNPQSFILEFKLSSLSPRVVKVSIGNKIINSFNLLGDGVEESMPNTKLILPPGKTTLNFNTDVQPISPNNGDGRLLSFKLRDFHFESEESFNKKKNENRNSVTLGKKSKINTLQEENLSLYKSSIATDGSLIYFGPGWSDDEITHRWSESSKAVILVTNDAKQKRPFTLEFKMTALTPRKVHIKIGSQNLGSVDIFNPSKKIEYKRIK
jgi:hypothetical protein